MFLKCLPRGITQTENHLQVLHGHHWPLISLRSTVFPALEEEELLLKLLLELELDHELELLLLDEDEDKE